VTCGSVIQVASGVAERVNQACITIKKARWWDRLGGKPVVHAASPRLIKLQKQLIFVVRILMYSLKKRLSKEKNKNPKNFSIQPHYLLWL